MTRNQSNEERLHCKLDTLAGEIASDLSTISAARSKELLSDFVSDLFLAVANQRRQEENRRKQAEGIAAAKARGVRFGRTKRPLPENFDEICQAWREKRIPLQKAADACGMPPSSFYDAAMRQERSAG